MSKLARLICRIVAVGFLLPQLCAGDPHAKSVRLTDKVYIPEIQLNKKIIPINTILYVGSWEIGSKAKQRTLCSFDQNNKTITFHFPAYLRKNTKPRIITRSNQNAFLNGVQWPDISTTHLAVKVKSNRRQNIVIETAINTRVEIFNNGKFICDFNKSDILDIEGVGHAPVTLEPGENILNFKLTSRQAPNIQFTLVVDDSQDFQAAWQTNNGLLQKLIHKPKDTRGIPTLNWPSTLARLAVDVDIRDVAEDKIVLTKEKATRNQPLYVDANLLKPGVYEAIYYTKYVTTSEYFIIGAPRQIFSDIHAQLAKYNPDEQTKLNISTQIQRANILLSEANYNITDRKWQEKTVYTLATLTAFKGALAKGALGSLMGVVGLHLRSFTSNIDGSLQSYRLFIPSGYTPNTAMPLLVLTPAPIAVRNRPFIEGPAVANHRSALLWSNYAEKHGVALLWPGYRCAPNGCTYEATRIEEAIQAVEKNYNIDRRKISVHASCGAGYLAGRLVSEYKNRFAAIVYERAIYDKNILNNEHIPTLKEWVAATNPSQFLINNKNLKIFVMHDNRSRKGHGEMELTTQFLKTAKEKRNDIVQCLGNRPAKTSVQDKIFSWISSVCNTNPDNKRSKIPKAAGYAGPISEIFATPLIIVQGTLGPGQDRAYIQSLAEHFRHKYNEFFHGAECVIKKDHEISESDVINNSLILVGNPETNSLWKTIMPDIPVTVTSDTVLFNNQKIGGSTAFTIITKHPYADDKYILLAGAPDLRNLSRIKSTNLFGAWYDCCIFEPMPRSIGKLNTLTTAKTHD